MKFRHGSFFSGFGGFDVAAEWMGWENMFHCEINPFCSHLLKYYWPNAISYDDITKTNFAHWRDRIDIVSGGFPCQPFSAAGKREGTDDARHLWPEYFGLLEKSPRAGSLAKTFTALLIGRVGWFSTRCVLTWKAKVTKSSRLMFFQLLPKTAPIVGIGFGLLPTVQARDHKNGSKVTDGRTQRKIDQGWTVDLNDRAALGMLPTPTATEPPRKPERIEKLKAEGLPIMSRALGSKSRQIGVLDALDFAGMLPTPTCQDADKATKKLRPDHQNNLTAIVFSTLPTPTATDYKGGGNRSDPRRQDDKLSNALHHLNKSPGTTSQLNPRYVAEMMGFPPSWTLGPFLICSKKALRVANAYRLQHGEKKV